MQLFAKPAKQGVMTVSTADGGELCVRLVGDEYFHQYFTEDGYPLVERDVIRKTKRSLKIKRSDSEPKTKRSLNRFLFVLVSSFFEGHILCVSCLQSFC